MEYSELAISSSTPLVGKTRTITGFLGTDFLASVTILGSFESASKSNMYIVKYPVFPELVHIRTMRLIPSIIL